MKYARICIDMVCIFHYVHYIRVWSVLDFALFCQVFVYSWLVSSISFYLFIVKCFFWNCFQKCYTFVIFSIFTWLYSSITDIFLLVNSQFLIFWKLFILLTWVYNITLLVSCQVLFFKKYDKIIIQTYVRVCSAQTIQIWFYRTFVLLLIPRKNVEIPWFCGIGGDKN